jgi:hypothetical protein
MATIQRLNVCHLLTSNGQLPAKTADCSVRPLNKHLYKEFGMGLTYLMGQLYL